MRKFRSLTAAVGGCFLLSPVAAPVFAGQPNVPEIHQSVTRYHESGAYQREFAEIMREAKDYLIAMAPKVKKPAIVLDVDETVISNWPEIKANQFAFFENGPCDHLPQGPCGDDGWEKRAEAPVFPESRDLIETARQHGVAVFLITGKPEKYRKFLEEDLRRQGVKGWKFLYMRSAGDHNSALHFKVPLRAAIESQGYAIIANIGDQPTDLVGPHSGKGFLLPNPFYRVP